MRATVVEEHRVRHLLLVGQSIDEALHQDMAKLVRAASHAVRINSDDGRGRSSCRHVAEGLGLLFGSRRTCLGILARRQSDCGIGSRLLGVEVELLRGSKALEVADSDIVVHKDIERVALLQLRQSLEGQDNRLWALEAACIDFHGSLLAGFCPDTGRCSHEAKRSIILWITLRTNNSAEADCTPFPASACATLSIA